MFKRTSPTVKHVRYPLASDATRRVSQSYGVYQPQAGLNQRGRFIINPKGTIMAVEILTGPVGRNTEELIRQIQAMQAVEKHPGKAAPAGWKPGQPLIDTRVPQDVGRY
jgi:peroxiredoxin (alkyl hydroperoxide reductase subunit C)